MCLNIRKISCHSCLILNFSRISYLALLNCNFILNLGVHFPGEAQPAQAGLGGLRREQVSNK